MIMGLPGSVYSTGLSTIWITIGLTIGAYVNYLVVAPRLRVYTEVARDAITLLIFQNRLNDKHSIIKIISGLIIVIFSLYILTLALFLEVNYSKAHLD